LRISILISDLKSDFSSQEATTPFIPANEAERQETLPRLQQILTARLAIAELPIQFTNVSISMCIQK
jgi:hypothetical protein